MLRYQGRVAAAALFVCLLAANAAAQQRRVDLRNTYERIICVVGYQGAGTPEDPKRPMFVPAPSAFSNPADRSGIIAYKQIASDDGRFAIVELVAEDRAAFK